MQGYGMDGWDWFWMVPMMILWAVVIGAVVYGAVRLAQHSDPRKTEKS
jgi:hypothetical protein